MKRRSAPRRRRGKKPELLEVWEHLVGELGGEVELTSKGAPNRACIPHREWTVVLDVHTVNYGEGSSTYTRARALFMRDGPFSLRVTQRNLFHALAPLVGWGGIAVGYGQLDRAVFVRSDQPQLARSALRGTSLGQMLLRNPRVKLVVTRPGKRIRKVAGESVGEVQVLKGGKVRDLPILRELVQMVTHTLDELDRLKVATEDPVIGVAV